MFVRFQIFVTVTCFLYQDAECIKQIHDTKTATKFETPNIEKRGGRSTRSLINLKNEEALEHVKRIVEYFENNGPLQEVKLREPCEPVKCGQCAADLCKSRESNNPPPQQPSSETKDTIVGAAMGNSWCPSEQLGITHHGRTSNNNNYIPRNEIVASPHQVFNSDTQPKKVITQPNVKQRKNLGIPRLNIEATLPITYNIQQPLRSNPRYFPVNEDLLPITLPTEEMVITTLPQIPIESLQSSMPQERTLLGFNYPQSSLATPYFGHGFPTNNFIVPAMCLETQQVSTKPFLGTTLPLLGLLAPKFPFKLFHRKPNKYPFQSFCALPRNLPTDNSESELNPLLGSSAPPQNVDKPVEIDLLTNDVNSEARRGWLPGLKPIFRPRPPIKGLTSYPIHAPSFQMIKPPGNLYNRPTSTQIYPTTYVSNSVVNPITPGYHKVNGLPIFSKNPHCREANVQFDIIDEPESAHHLKYNETLR